MRVEYINPFVAATTRVFREMLGCELVRYDLRRKTGRQPSQDVSGIIELSGRAQGAVVLGLSRELAIRATEVLLQESIPALDGRVLDAVGELTNVIAGNAKAQLEELHLSISLPRIIVGRNHTLPLECERFPIDIFFTSPWGNFVVEVGLVDRESDACAGRHSGMLATAV